MKCPCKGCENRTITCHGFCEEYKGWKVWLDGVNKERSKDECVGLSRELLRKYWKNLMQRK